MPTPLDRATSQRVSESWISWDLLYVVGMMFFANKFVLTCTRLPSSPLPLLLLASRHGAFGAKIFSQVVILLAVCVLRCNEITLLIFAIDPDTWTRDQCVAWLNNVSQLEV